MKPFTLEQLAAGIKERHVGVENGRLVEKWSRTGLLRGLENVRRENMARLLENQAAQMLRESSGLSGGGGAVGTSGQIAGFTNIAFPIVRRVFGGLVANELISIQPMSLPSGLIFYIDYTYGSNVGGDAGFSLSNTSLNETYKRGDSIYNNPTGAGVRSGSLATGGMYDIVGAGYSRLHQETTALSASNTGVWINAGSGGADTWLGTGMVTVNSQFTGTNARLTGFDMQLDSDLLQNLVSYTFMHIPVSSFTTTLPKGDLLAVDQIALFGLGGFTTAHGVPAVVWGQNYQGGANVLNLRRLNKRGTLTNQDQTNQVFTPNPLNGTHIQLVLNGGSSPALVGAVTGISGTLSSLTASCVITDQLVVDSNSGAALTIPSFESDFGNPPSAAIPEIDIKIESIAITAQTRKLRARWSPELAQDLNAYHSLDAEVELTHILSEQIALEIDREILSDLVTQANGANLFWSRAPGKFVNKITGQPVSLASSLAIGPTFQGTVREWYETLVETIIDVANTIHRKTLRGSANFMVTSPDVATILEASVLYKPKMSLDGDGQVASPFTIGAEPVGTLSNRFTVYKDPYFPRNKVLVGFKGGSYLETGYVYSPYVPLIVTPTIFAPEDFTPRKGVMTRYGKKMVRSDFYGTVNILDMNII
jgi:Major capsid protein Gp23